MYEPALPPSFIFASRLRPQFDDACGGVAVVASVCTATHEHLFAVSFHGVSMEMWQLLNKVKL